MQLALFLVSSPGISTGYQALQEARDREQTSDFRAVYAPRAGVEGTFAQAIRMYVKYYTRISVAKSPKFEAPLTLIPPAFVEDENRRISLSIGKSL